MSSWLSIKKGFLFLVFILIYLASTYTYAKDFQESLFSSEYNIISIPIFLYYVAYFFLIVIFSQGSVYFLYSIDQPQTGRKILADDKKEKPVGKESRRPERILEVIKPTKVKVEPITEKDPGRKNKKVD